MDKQQGWCKLKTRKQVNGKRDNIVNVIPVENQARGGFRDNKHYVNQVRLAGFHKL